MTVRSMSRAEVAAIAAAFAAASAMTTMAGCDGGETGGGTSMTTASSSGSASSSSGAGGQGGQGGSSGVACVDAAAYAGLFTIEDAELCAVAVYTADAAIASYESSPTWGSHGGLVTVAKGAAAGGLEITRWTTPAGASGKLTGKTEAIDAAIPGEFFVGAQAIDLPFFGWTALSWTAKFPATGGEVLLVKSGAVAQRYDVNGFFSGAGVGVSASGRLLYSGLSALGDAATSMSGLYAGDTCGTDAMNPRLTPDGDATCAAPSDVALWGESSGPVAVDRAGNVFAVMTSFSTGDQEARGFEASTVARGAPKTAGATLFKALGFGTALAAIAPDASAVGVLAFQPSDGATGAALDVIEQRYSAPLGSVKGEGNTSVLLKLSTPGTLLTMTSDDQDRLWVAGTDGASGTLIVVIARAATPHI